MTRPVCSGVAMRPECSGLRRVRQTSDKAALGPEKPTLHTLRSTLQPQGTHSDSASERRTRQKSRARSEVGPRRLSGSPNPGCARSRLGHQKLRRWDQPGRRIGTLQRVGGRNSWERGESREDLFQPAPCTSIHRQRLNRAGHRTALRRRQQRGRNQLEA